MSSAGVDVIYECESISQGECSRNYVDAEVFSEIGEHYIRKEREERWWSR
jgi:hypothetical protein